MQNYSRVTDCFRM